jgi:hypothetical protein
LEINISRQPSSKRKHILQLRSSCQAVEKLSTERCQNRVHELIAGNKEGTDLDVVGGDGVVKIRNVKLSPGFNAQGLEKGGQDFGNLFEHIMLPYTLVIRSLAGELLQENTRRQGIASTPEATR